MHLPELRDCLTISHKTRPSSTVIAKNGMKKKLKALCSKCRKGLPNSVQNALMFLLLCKKNVWLVRYFFLKTILGNISPFPFIYATSFVIQSDECTIFRKNKHWMGHLKWLEPLLKTARTANIDTHSIPLGKIPENRRKKWCKWRNPFKWRKQEFGFF